jgi:dihydrofolate reductase
VGLVWIADHFASIPKYVASRGTPALPWRDSHLLGPDLAAETAALRERHESVHVIGSIEFARSLIADGLFDVLNLWVHPIVVGPGKRLFPDDGPPTGLRLIECAPASEKGVVLLRYGPGGALDVGDIDA